MVRAITVKTIELCDRLFLAVIERNTISHEIVFTFSFSNGCRVHCEHREDVAGSRGS